MNSSYYLQQEISMAPTNKHIIAPHQHNMVLRQLEASISVKKKLSNAQIDDIYRIGQRIIDAYSRGNKLLIFGNGGSAADAQHLAAELVGRFMRERQALPAIALTTDTSILTAVGNDYGFEDIFARQIEALGHHGDIAMGISTSGRSPNVLKAMSMAKQLGLITIGFTGQNGKDLAEISELHISVPSANTARIQECYVTIFHILCEIVDQAISGEHHE
jgi:D-sedoheptulose 7-phosphate isomerase